MTAKMLPMRGLPQGKPCGSGTVPGELSAECGQVPARPYAAGWRCDRHKPRSSRTTGSIFDVPAVRTTEQAA